MIIFGTFSFAKALSISPQTKLESKRLTLSSIQKEIEQTLEDKTFSLPPEAPVAVKQPERYSAVKTPGNV